MTKSQDKSDNGGESPSSKDLNESDESANDPLRQYLASLSEEQNVIGSVIFGWDGEAIAHSMPPEEDVRTIGTWALAIYMNSAVVTRKIQQREFYCIVCRALDGTCIIADFGSKFVATLCKMGNVELLFPLLDRLSSAIARQRKESG